MLVKELVMTKLANPNSRTALLHVYCIRKRKRKPEVVQFQEYGETDAIAIDRVKQKFLESSNDLRAFSVLYVDVYDVEMRFDEAGRHVITEPIFFKSSDFRWDRQSLPYPGYNTEILPPLRRGM